MKGAGTVIARTELRQLRQSPDFWGPMLVLAAFFFVISPASLLSAVTSASEVEIVQKVGDTLTILPESTQAKIKGDTATAKTSYALAVYLFAPLAVVVPMTICTAVGAASLVGERERGTGEFLAHSPATDRQIYAGKLVASFLPGYATTLAGFAAYSVLVNTLVGPLVGGWFFPTPEWWVLVTWVVPPFLLLALAAVLFLSGRVKSSAAAQQASGLITLPLILVSYGQASGELIGIPSSGAAVGAIAWVAAGAALLVGGRIVRRERLLGVD